MMLRRTGLILFLLLVLAAVYVAADWWIAVPEEAPREYVRREACIECHQPEYEDWQESDHDRAMDRAGEGTVLGDFDDVEFTHQGGEGEAAFRGVTSRMFRRDGKYYVRTDGPDGKIQDFEVPYVFGVRPLQQYLVEFPDGRLQCLPTAWDTETRRWFHLYPTENIPHTDPLHWTRRLQNWNYMCADCHTTDLKKNYDLKTNTYHTTWSEIDVSCEACHGPGSLHCRLAEANSLFWDRRVGYGLPNLKSEDSRVLIETCAPCHCRRRVIYPGWVAGSKFLDFYVPELLDGELYYPDGQILEEDYVYSSFIQSKMYMKGVRCTDCHDPHSTRVKFDDNRLCTSCHLGTHPSGQYDTQAHHHHPDASQPGTLCVECHMPQTSYMVVDPRRDHSFQIPRPELTVWSRGEAGIREIPNACNRCHHDESKGETPEWAVEQLRQWYPQRIEPPHFAHALAAGRQLKPEGERLLKELLRRKDLSPMVRASALVLLGRYPHPTGHPQAVEALEDPEDLIRVAAVRAVGGVPDAQHLYRLLVPRLSDSIRAVRVEAARAISRVPLSEFSRRDRQAFEAALEEFITGQKFLAEQPGTHLNLGYLYANLGQPERAVEEYHTALRLEPEFVEGHVNLAMLQAERGQTQEAINAFHRAIELREKTLEHNRQLLSHYRHQGNQVLIDQQQQAVDASTHELGEICYSLGLLLAEQPDRLEEAAEQLARAAQHAAANARIHYNYGLALQKLGRMEEAEAALKQACRLAPGAADHLHALAVFYVQQGRWASAAACAEELVRRWPRVPEFQRLKRLADDRANTP